MLVQEVNIESLFVKSSSKPDLFRLGEIEKSDEKLADKVSQFSVVLNKFTVFGF